MPGRSRTRAQKSAFFDVDVDVGEQTMGEKKLKAEAAVSEEEEEEEAQGRVGEECLFLPCLQNARQQDKTNV
jgi:hypothetical protein